MKKVINNWPGWSIKENPFGEEFDNEARNRMMANSKKLIPYIIKYKKKINGRLLEIGPFFNPLLNCKIIKSRTDLKSNITFIENDSFAIEYLKSICNCTVLDIDLNKDFELENFSESFRSVENGKLSFDIIIISQVLNYVDFSNLLYYLYQVLNISGFIFINNSIDYGIPTLFSEKRPRSNEDIANCAVSLKYSIVEESYLPKVHKKEIFERLILVLKKM